ncbi:MAG TPA: RDD family protein [Candidatus Limnocylindrales bacterium]|nr:RDD family protein [Candidatus Limnocylindrales bacterium]
MNTICSQCGAVLSSGERACHFCDHPEFSSQAESLASTQGNLALRSSGEEEWRGELNQRLQAYRARRRKAFPNEAQTELPFESRHSSAMVAVQTEEPQTVAPDPNDNFAFTIAIGRPPQKAEPDDSRLLIDVSLPPLAEDLEDAPELPEEPPSDLYPVATLHERRRAALIDAACLAFAYGGFLALFGSLGGQFTLSKLSGVVCFSTFAFVYIQYFGLFTIFGATTPGMMVRGLQVASFTGESPTAKQLFWRTAGYMISAGTFFLGFFWALWDEDAMTWHDRLSRTYLAVPETFADAEISQASPVR